ncbi:hypothetical protein [Nocardia sp. NPDC057272]|uniref:hypothetical protein n=1 Tax=Nocardia sp. NPDC057272 TaxID=3346079 RepID=UPI003634E124
MSATNARGSQGKSDDETPQRLPSIRVVDKQFPPPELDHHSDRRRRGNPQVQPGATHIAVSDHRGTRCRGSGRTRKIPAQSGLAPDLRNSH